CSTEILLFLFSPSPLSFPTISRWIRIQYFRFHHSHSSNHSSPLCSLPILAASAIYLEDFRFDIFSPAGTGFGLIRAHYIHCTVFPASFLHLDKLDITWNAFRPHS